MSVIELAIVLFFVASAYGFATLLSMLTGWNVWAFFAVLCVTLIVIAWQRFDWRIASKNDLRDRDQ